MPSLLPPFRPTPSTAPSQGASSRRSLLGWSAWQRVLALLPLLILLWAATAWALADTAPW